MAGHTPHISGVVARGDALTIHLLEPLPDFISRLAQPAFCAVPSSTPVDPRGVRLIPSAGPYSVASFTPGQGVVLARNPNYRGRRPHRFERIELTPSIPSTRAVADIAAGRSDLTTLFGSSPRTLRALDLRLRRRYGAHSLAAAAGRQRYFVRPGLTLDFLALNTHRALFADARMRRAVNYAVDRRGLARLGNGVVPLPEPPTDQYLPPGMVGFRPARVYPPTPDVARARALTKGRHHTAVLYVCSSTTCVQEAQIIKNDLGAIGLRVAVKRFPLDALYRRSAAAGEPYDLAVGGWVADYPDPSAVLTPLLRDASNYPTFDAPSYRRRLAETDRLAGPRRYLAYGRLDVDLARRAAPLVPIGNPPSHDFFSPRIGCQAYGVYGLDLAGLCLRPKGR
jgi:peptide/nickel transport system substrate-binding protein